jgi:hypothetical protein
VRLYFREHYADQILAGTKTTTVRRTIPKKAPVEIQAWTRRRGHFATLRVLGITALSVDALTESDARMDGFESVEKLRKELGRLYPEQAVLWRYAFELV